MFPAQHLSRYARVGSAVSWFTAYHCLEAEPRVTLGDLQVIQNQVVRLITKSSRLENRETMFDQVGWLTVFQLIRYHTILTIYRIRKSGEPENLFKYLCLDNRNGNIIIPQSSLTLYRNSFIYRGIIDWNNIPKPTRSLEKIGHFNNNSHNIKTAFKGILAELEYQQCVKLQCIAF